MHNDKRTDAPGIREIWNEFPPQDLDAERAVLGSMLLSPRAAITDVADLVQPGDFYSDAHVRIAKVIFELAETTIGGIDAVTVGSELAKRGELEQVGHAPYLENLLATVGHASHARYYADTVREMADRRRAIQEHKAAIAQALDCTKPFATNGRS